MPAQKRKLSRKAKAALGFSFEELAMSRNCIAQLENA